VTRNRTVLALGVPDKAMSASHAKLVRDGSDWSIEDAGSRNGMLVNGARETRAELNDGDIIELGETFWLFRSRTSVTDSEDDRSPDLDSSQLTERLPGLRTFTPELDDAYHSLAKITGVHVPILLHAESGTGKELCARALHALSRRPGAFVAVNCGALTDTLAASELFGYRKGAFSGATDDREGLVRSADKGTLFLDEIADLPLPLQATLLRVLQEREVMPVGATRPITVDLDIVAASHRDLTALVRAELFRHDLYARLAGYTARLTPLRERREDFGLLVAALLSRAPFGRTARLTPNAARTLLAYHWPLNVRELEQCLTVASTLASGGTIHRRHLPELIRAQAIVPAPALAEVEPPLDDVTSNQRKTELVALLREHRGNISAIARATGWHRVQIHRWLKRFDLDPRPYRC